MIVKIYTLDNIDKEKWDKMAIKNSVIFQTYEWGIANKEKGKNPIFFVIEDGREWLGGWLVFHLKSSIRNKMIIPSEPVVMVEQRLSIIEGIWNEIEKYSMDNNVIEVKLSPYTTRWEDEKFLLGKRFETRRHGSNILNLTKPISDLHAGLHKKHRNIIRKAEKMRMIVEEGNDLDLYYKLSEETYKRSGGKGPSYEFLKKLYENLNPKKMCRIFFTKHENKILAATFMLFCGDRVYYFQGASAEKTYGASNLLQWEIIKKAKVEGYKWYDFSGFGGLRGIDRFKERFGGDMKIYYSGYKVYSPRKKYLLKKIKTLKNKL